MADELDPVTQRFEADVNEYVTEVQEAADEAKRFADSAEEAKIACGGLRDGALEAGEAIGHVRDETAEATLAMDAYKDAAGRWRDGAGQFVTAAEAEALSLGHVRDEALEATVAMREMKKENDSASRDGLLFNLLSQGSKIPGSIGPLPLASLLAIVPAIEALLPLLAGVLAGFAAAGAGAGAFALLAIPAITKVTGAYSQIKTDQKAYDDALTASAKNTALQKLHNDLKGLDPAERGALTGLQSLSAEYHKLSKAFEPQAFKIFDDVLKVANELLPEVTPFATTFANALGPLLTRVSGFAGSAGFKSWLQEFKGLEGPSVTAIGNGIGRVGVAIGHLLTIMSKKDVVNAINIAFGILAGTVNVVAYMVKRLMTNWDEISGAARRSWAVIKEWSAVAVASFDLARGGFDEMRHDIATGFDNLRHGIATDGHMIASYFDDVRHDAATMAHDVAARFDETRHGIAAAVSGFPGLLVHAGAALVDGLIHGIESKADQLRHEVAHLGDDVVGWAKDALGIASPSKEFAALGEQITAGLTLGINSTRQQAINESKFLAEQVSDAFADGIITKSQDASLAKKLATALTTALKGGVQDAFGSGTLKQIGESAQKLLQTIWDTEKGGFIGKAQASQFAGWVKADNATLQSLAVQRNAIAKEIAAAQALARNTASAAESTFNLSSASTTAAGGQASAGGIISNLNADVGKIRRFAWAIRKLAKEGLNKSYLSQLISLGPEQGGPIAAELAGAGLGDIKSINAAESAITYESNQLGANAVSAMYTAGKQSGAGFLQGLKDQKKAIEALMSQIAAGVIGQLRKDLGIASPSRVMFEHGVSTLQGYINGVKSMQPQLQALMKSIGGGVALGGVGGVAAGGGSGYGGAGQVHVTVPLTAIFGAGSGSLATDPRFMQFIQAAVQEAVARWSLNNPGTGFGLPGRA